MEKKTIAFAFTWLFNPRSGGTERVTDIIAKELIARGYNVHYIYSVKRTTDNEFSCPVKNVHYIDEEVLLSDSGEMVLNKIIIENGIDLVINQGGLMGTCKRFSDLPQTCKSITVIHFDPRYGLNTLLSDLRILRDKSYIEKLKRIYRIFAYPKRKHQLKQYLHNLYTYWGQHSDRVILLSSHFKNDFLNLAKDFPIKKLHSIGNPISFPIKKNIDRKQNIILWVGRMKYHQKRPDLMIKIWSKVHKFLPGWQLIMLGDGPDYSEIKKLASKLPRVTFPGNQPSQPYFERAKIHASTSNLEGLPMVLIEACSQGVIPIAFDSFASIHDIIESDRQLVQPFDIDEYAEKLIEIARNDKMQNGLREQGYRIIDKFKVSSIVDKWENLFKEIFCETA